MHEPAQGTKEAEMLEVLRNPKDWIWKLSPAHTHTKDLFNSDDITILSLSGLLLHHCTRFLFPKDVTEAFVFSVLCLFFFLVVCFRLASLILTHPGLYVTCPR